MSDVLTTEERQMAEVIVTALNLEHIQADSVDPGMPLFGQSSPGWGLDSIDALEIVVMLETEFGIKVKNESSARDYFRSISTLAELVEEKLAAVK